MDKEDLGVEHNLPFSSRLMRGCAVKQKIMIMEKQTQDLIKKAYFAFNARDIDMALSTMHPNVQWPKAFEGGYVNGHPEIRKYWTRQWTEINPNVEPVEFNERQDGTLEIMVHQIVKDLAGNLMFDGRVKHMYTLQDGLLRRMDIELL
ncbi:nuclear transport factor 2 family protein [Parapedobacter sp. 10938]|uniref:nuclear transport factor 2 family protein n=1 Tax=Parapedobacter flavus TaxID=3110225 RepID=UPI002DB8519A|nr:nuclear transport factor 2 family protein [Parapedobacter sp. 10938]MEC3880174.1 nuclear transport factor 2 family protein [Parapedobacter sp. 10938]